MVMITVLAGAGVFLEFAGRALFEVQVELLSDGLGIGLLLDLHNGGEVVAGGDGLVADELVAILGEGELGGGGAISKGDGHDLGTRSDDLVVVIHETDLDLVVLVHEKLSVGFDFMDEAATGRAGLRFMLMVVLFCGVHVRGSEACDEEAEGEEFRFHIVFRFGGLVLLSSLVLLVWHLTSLCGAVLAT